MSSTAEYGPVKAAITVSLDGYVTGPDDHAGQGLGVGGERLHYWVMGGPWTYETEREPGAGMSDEDRAYFDTLLAGTGAGLCGRGMYDSAGGWGGRNPFQGTLVVLTHRTADQPDPSSGFLMVDGFDEALAAARRAAGDGGVAIGGGADVIRQALTAGVVDELGISTAPVVLGRGKRLFEGFDRDLDLKILSVHHSPYAVHVRYAVLR
ncbi:dihydrofolate reductase family protein [Micromonospora halotolerans]|uniref:Dihydrofolate reductase family protein n=1 Tax=Micromonospora halotolerans TaxID=709879 RepID=A0ABY9ZXF6_9ACTN|nr:dihydrofolate reductase family protein [Micromonospora halotolerans]WNM39742.1 dihydrofolate reductase family protein [Micromonospora halotolerans]